MKLIEEKGLTFDDVLLVPRYNRIKSRQDVNLTTRLTKCTFINSPIVSANMDTVTGKDMIIAMNGHGTGILHRFMDIEETVSKLEYINGTATYPICASIGVGEKAYCRAQAIRYKCDIICIDVAHGHCKQVIKMIEDIKNWGDSLQVIAGNVATAHATRDLINAGADAIKVGIGPGSMCTTRLVTGNGVPQLSAIIECAEEAAAYDIPVIADGGIKTSGDMVKALAAGASSVMIGSLLAGTDETPGEVAMIDSDEPHKVYRGMASKDAMTGWKGNYHAAPEGETTLIRCKGSVKNIVNELLAGIRSGLTYQGVDNIRKLQHVAKFRLISPNCLIENRPHGK